MSWCVPERFQSVFVPFFSTVISCPGGQAEYVRRPFADTGLLLVPDGLKDEQVLLLSDVLCTGYHATECARLQQQDTVCIWGAGPIGLSCAYMALRVKKVKRVIIIDNVPYRLQMAQRIGCETINFDEVANVPEVSQIS